MDIPDDAKGGKLQRFVGHALSGFGTVAGRFVGPLVAILSFLITGLSVIGLLVVVVAIWLLTEVDASGAVLELHDIMVTYFPVITQATGPMLLFGAAATILGRLAVVPGGRLLGRVDDGAKVHSRRPYSITTSAQR